MTREEAINKLVNARYADEFQGDEELTTAHNMAIEALEQEPCILDDAREDFMHDVYNTLDFLPTNNEANRIIDSFDRVTSDLETTRKKGKWIYHIDEQDWSMTYPVKCSNCNTRFTWSNYCPNCGAEMESE